MKLKHASLLEDLKGKEKIKVVFLVINTSVWKVDIVFKKMLEDPLFDPEILVCPYTLHGEKRMLEDMEKTYNYFSEKNYPVRVSINKNGDWVKLEEVKPDIVFFTNPHKLTYKEYYENAYLNYLSCYVPYFTDIASDYNLQSVYNQLFHNAIWINFVGSEYSYQRAYRVASNKGVNLLVSGNLTIEEIIHAEKTSKKAWKFQKDIKKKIIYAPHQSVNKNESPNLSTFLEFAESIKKLAIKYESETQWSFKPHTLLKEKLYLHSDWGKERTDNYYSFWDKSNNTQLDTGGYAGLFMESDAIIHDCGSFILEYLITKKPCGYLLFNEKRQLAAINDFGLQALECYERLRSSSDIEIFIKNIIECKYIKNKKYSEFIYNNMQPVYYRAKPSDVIIEELKGRLL